MRREYEMTDEQHAAIMDACKPTPVMWLGGPPRTPQGNANDAWRRLATELGFVWDSVRPVPGKNAHFFTAEVA